MQGRSAGGGWLARVAGAAALCALLACGGGAPRVRAVSLSPAITRVVATLGLSDAITPVDPSAPDALTQALASGAKLALADGGAESAGVRAAFASRNVAVHVFAPQSSDEVYAAYRDIATLLGDAGAGDDLAARVKRELGKPASAAKDDRPKVALVLQRQPLRVVAGDGFLSRVLAAAGADNAFADLSGASVAIRPELMKERSPRALDVSPELAAGAWVDPSAAAQQLRDALAAPPR